MAGLVTTAFQPDQSEDARSVATPGTQGDGTVQVADLRRILWHRRKWVLGTCLLLTALALLYGLLTPKLYTATAQVLVDPRDRQVVNNDINSNAMAPDGGVTHAESQTSVVQSTGVLQRAIAATNLTNDPEFNRPAGFAAISALTGLFGGHSAGTPGDAEIATLNALRRSLTVKRADKVLVIDVGVTARSPEKAARLANAIVDAYLADQAGARAQAADEASNALTARLAEQAKRVRDAENAIERYRAENNLVVSTGQLVSEQQLTDVSNQLSAAQNRVATLKAQVDQIQKQRRGGGASPDDTTEAMQSTVVSKLREQESALVQRDADLETQLGPRHPAIAAVRVELSKIRQSINTELDRVAKAVRSDYDRAVASEVGLSAKLDGLKRQTLSNDQASVRLRELQRELEAVRSVYANYLVRAQETREQANVDSTNARIISRALPPQQKSWPPLGLLLAGAIGAGLGLGAGTALIAEYVSPTVLSAGQAELVTGAPVIGILPAGRRPAPRRRLFGRKQPEPEGYAAVGLNGQNRGSRTEDAVGLVLRRLFDMDSGSRDPNVVRSVLLTSSPEDGAERNRAAQLLAAAAALRGERVLLIDANVAHDQETSVAGLLEVLRGERSFESVLHFQAGARWAIMGKGRQKASFHESAGRSFAKRMLVEARRQFDLVVVNGGAVAENLKAAPLVASVQDLLLVARLTATPERDLAATAQVLNVMGRSVTAVLLVDPAARA